MAKTTSQDQSASSDSVHEEGHVQDMKATLYFHNPELSMNNTSHAEIGQPIFPYAYPDPYCSGLYTAYGPHNMIQPPVMVGAAGRIPLPADIPEDCPIYVNAKQYHGILRRRQTRAKLEAQNKLVKNRKPYLHESRHQHALNRVRGNGGRFLSTKKAQHSDQHPPNSGSHGGGPNSFLFGRKMIGSSFNNENHRVGSDNAEGRSSGDVDLPEQDGGSGGGGGGGFVYNGNRHYASIVR